MSLVNGVCMSLSLASIVLSTGEEAMTRMEVNMRHSFLLAVIRDLQLDPGVQFPVAEHYR